MNQGKFRIRYKWHLSWATPAIFYCIHEKTKLSIQGSNFWHGTSSHQEIVAIYKQECSQSWSSNLSENTLKKTKNNFFLDACTDLTHFCILIDQNNIVNFWFAMICSRNCFIHAHKTNVLNGIVYFHWSFQIQEKCLCRYFRILCDCHSFSNTIVNIHESD